MLNQTNETDYVIQLKNKIKDQAKRLCELQEYKVKYEKLNDAKNNNYTSFQSFNQDNTNNKYSNDITNNIENKISEQMYLNIKNELEIMTEKNAKYENVIKEYKQKYISIKNLYDKMKASFVSSENKIEKDFKMAKFNDDYGLIDGEMKFPNPNKVLFENFREAYTQLFNYSKNLLDEKNKLKDQLNEEIILNEECKSFISILNQTIESSIIKHGLNSCINYNKSNHYKENSNDLEVIIDIAMVKKENDELTKKDKQSRECIGKLNSQLSCLKNEYENLLSKLQILEESNKNLKEKENVNISDILLNCEKNTELLNKKVEAYSRENDSLQKQINNKNEEISKLNEKNNNYEQIIKNLKKNINSSGINNLENLNGINCNNEKQENKKSDVDGKKSIKINLMNDCKKDEIRNNNENSGFNFVREKNKNDVKLKINNDSKMHERNVRLNNFNIDTHNEDSINCNTLLNHNTNSSNNINNQYPIQNNQNSHYNKKLEEVNDYKNINIKHNNINQNKPNYYDSKNIFRNNLNNDYKLDERRSKSTDLNYNYDSNSFKGSTYNQNNYESKSQFKSNSTIPNPNNEKNSNMQKNTNDLKVVEILTNKFETEIKNLSSLLNLKQQENEKLKKSCHNYENLYTTAEENIRKTHYSYNLLKSDYDALIHNIKYLQIDNDKLLLEINKTRENYYGKINNDNNNVDRLLEEIQIHKLELNEFKSKFYNSEGNKEILLRKNMELSKELEITSRKLDELLTTNLKLQNVCESQKSELITINRENQRDCK